VNGEVQLAMERLRMHVGEVSLRIAPDGALVRIDRCLIDANWGQSSDVVYQFCRRFAASCSRSAAPSAPSARLPAPSNNRRCRLI